MTDIDARSHANEAGEYLIEFLSGDRSYAAPRGPQRGRQAGSQLSRHGE
jgi:hypothetical protein